MRDDQLTQHSRLDEHESSSYNLKDEDSKGRLKSLYHEFQMTTSLVEKYKREMLTPRTISQVVVQDNKALHERYEERRKIKQNRLIMETKQRIEEEVQECSFTP